MPFPLIALFNSTCVNFLTIKTIISSWVIVSSAESILMFTWVLYFFAWCQYSGLETWIGVCMFICPCNILRDLWTLSCLSYDISEISIFLQIINSLCCIHHSNEITVALLTVLGFRNIYFLFNALGIEVSHAAFVNLHQKIPFAGLLQNVNLKAFCSNSCVHHEELKGRWNSTVFYLKKILLFWFLCYELNPSVTIINLGCKYLFIASVFSLDS